MTRLEFTVDADNAGERLDRFLAGEIPQQSRSQIQRLIDEGHVTVTRTNVGRTNVGQTNVGRTNVGRTNVGRNFSSATTAKPAKANLELREGDVITIALPDLAPATAAAEDIPLDILFDDDDIVVVNKPAGMVVHPAAGNPGGTLVNALLHHVKHLSGIGGEARPGIVHRLDKGTSGVMVVAKHDAAHRELARQVHDREVQKEYVALVWGLVQQRKRINAAIGRDPKNRLKMSTRASRARDAVTRVTWSRDLRGVTLCRISIHTGRTHQIRVHMSAIGHPIVGDALYGGVHRRVPHPLRAVTTLTRPFLHAESLTVTHPRTQERLTFTAPLPSDLEEVAMALAPPELRDSIFVRDPLTEHTGNREID